ncbi:DUF5681 domain-containing protein [Brevundimonas staleyi]|uniref:DUF5681 domain-containing protein n=1 Tax=Brevundimonas staleyi TaxID=74326 RepID=A0ABW0FYY4_9CAUL
MIASRAERIARTRTPDGRFRDGVSGNPSGRPRSKHQRAISSRQYRRDVLMVTEELIPAKTATGVKHLPFHVVNLLSIRAKASQGHAASQRYLDKLHREAVEAHEEANPRLTRVLESREAEVVNKSAAGLQGWEWRDLNLFRKWSWRV